MKRDKGMGHMASRILNLVLNGGKLSALRPDYFMYPDIIWTASLTVLYVLCSG